MECKQAYCRLVKIVLSHASLCSPGSCSLCRKALDYHQVCFSVSSQTQSCAYVPSVSFHSYYSSLPHLNVVLVFFFSLVCGVQRYDPMLLLSLVEAVASQNRNSSNSFSSERSGVCLTLCCNPVLGSFFTILFKPLRTIAGIIIASSSTVFRLVT